MPPPVPPEGSSEALVVILGRNPGREERARGVPFYKQAPGGRTLNGELERLGYSRSKLWVTNTTCCHCPNDEEPSVEETIACRPWLMAQLLILRPRVVVALGALAAKMMLGEGSFNRFSEVNGQAYEVTLGGVAEFTMDVVPIYHPGSAVRQRRYKEQMRRGFNALNMYLEERDLIGWVRDYEEEK